MKTVEAPSKCFRNGSHTRCRSAAPAARYAFSASLAELERRMPVVSARHPATRVSIALAEPRGTTESCVPGRTTKARYDGTRLRGGRAFAGEGGPTAGVVLSTIV